MRIESSNLIAAQAARSVERPQPPAEKPAAAAKADFQPVDFPKKNGEVKRAKDVSEAKPDLPRQPPQRAGSHLDIKV
jgi:hypothetical protein